MELLDYFVDTGTSISCSSMTTILRQHTKFEDFGLWKTDWSLVTIVGGIGHD